MGIWLVDREGGVIGVCMHLADRQWGGVWCWYLMLNGGIGWIWEVVQWVQ